eukprot:TRINITY_DN19460_c0_g1_i1.p1 TRINITY_DN19460_c0_g1~~TRINITY_DN19460_c0_g1_i1.p1  ORF type:complete len:240 (+),score=50.21 TRINITY_DN19460_c0_g1_i1:1225-1944(+)
MTEGTSIEETQSGIRLKGSNGAFFPYLYSSRRTDWSLSDLPREMINCIATEADGPSLRALSCVCKKFNDVIRKYKLKKVRWNPTPNVNISDSWEFTNKIDEGKTGTTVHADIGYSSGRRYWTITAAAGSGAAVGVMHFSEIDQGTQWTKHRIGYFLPEGQTVGVLLDVGQQQILFFKDGAFESKKKLVIDKNLKNQVAKKANKSRLFPVVSVWGSGNCIKAEFDIPLPEDAKFFLDERH